jgi:tRNA pseudouridine38-40 synthase
MDLESMQKAASLITGEHDFASFESAGAQRSSTIRHIIDLQVVPESVHNFPGLEIAITANGFLYNMVRNIVGTLIRVGKNREEVEWVAWVRDQKNRRYAGQTAPAHGLFLDHVVY